MADEFSWTDRLSAFSSCLPCLSSLPCFHSGSSPQTGPIRLPADDGERSLRGLLSSSSSQHTTLDADALSLHSTVDSSGRRKPRSAGRARNVLRRQPKRVSVMGVALFGRPIRDDELSPNEDEHDDERVIRITSEGSGSGDAQPVRIDDALLARIANARGGIDSQRFSHVQSKSSHTHGHLSTTSGPLSPRTTLYTDDAPNSPMDEIDEEEALAKAERKARRRERRALKQAALSLALAEDPRATFEGFQGSGSTHAAIPDYFRQSVASPLSEARSSESGTSSGRRAQPVLSAPQGEHEDMADGDADFGAQAYTTRRTDGSSADGRSSDTRSRTSASRSTGAGPHPVDETAAKPRRSKSDRSKKSSKNSSTSASSAPLASPASAAFEARDVQIAAVLEDHEQQEQPWVRPVESDQISRFPSSGLGGGLRRKNSDAGALLATRGGF